MKLTFNKILFLTTKLLLPIFWIVISCKTKIPTDHTSVQLKDLGQSEPIERALKFLNSYVDNCNKMQQAIEVYEWVNSNKLTTKKFTTELKKIVDEANKIDPEVRLDADPIFDAQDYPDKGFELDLFDSKTNYIVVKGKNWPEFKLTLKMVFENNNWLVDGCGIINIPNDRRIARTFNNR